MKNEFFEFLLCCPLPDVALPCPQKIENTLRLINWCSIFNILDHFRPVTELYCFALCYISLCKVLINSQKFIVEGVGVNQLSACT